MFYGTSTNNFQFAILYTSRSKFFLQALWIDRGFLDLEAIWRLCHKPPKFQVEIQIKTRDIWRIPRALEKWSEFAAGFYPHVLFGRFQRLPLKKHIKEMMVVSTFWVMFIWGINSKPDLKVYHLAYSRQREFSSLQDLGCNIQVAEFG